MQANEEQIRSLMVKGGWKEFEGNAQEARMELTYQVLCDLANINAAPPGQNQSLDQSSQAATPEQTKSRLVQNYIQNIQQIQALVAQQKLSYYQEQTKEYSADIQTSLSDQKEIRSEELLQAQINLSSQLSTSLSSLRTFVQNVGNRIKHQRYLNDQNEIYAYFQRQKSTFLQEKSSIQKHIRDHNYAVKQHIQIAQHICKHHQNQIHNLQTQNTHLQKQIETATSNIEQINQKQIKIYKQNSSLNQQNLVLKANHEAKHHAKKNVEKQNPKEENLRQSNLGSQIMPPNQQRKEESSISMPEIGAEEPQASPKCEIQTDHLKTELMARKMCILPLLIMGLVVFFM